MSKVKKPHKSLMLNIFFYLRAPSGTRKVVVTGTRKVVGVRTLAVDVPIGTPAVDLPIETPPLGLTTEFTGLVLGPVGLVR
jgi:hypothetical protein